MQANLIEVQAFTQYIHAITSDAGLGCHFDLYPDETPYNNGKELHLFKIQPNCTTQQLDQIRAYIVHEVGHKLYTDFDIMRTKPELASPVDDKSSLVKQVWTQLEDHRVDYLTVAHGDYVGDKHNLMNLEDIISEQVIPDVLKNIENLDFNTTVLATVYAMDIQQRDGFLPGAGIPGDNLYEALSTKAKRTKVVKKLHKHDYELAKVREIMDPKLGSEATYQLAIKLVEDAEKQEEEDKKEQQQQNGQGDGDGSKDNADGDENKEVAVQVNARPQHEPEGETVTVDESVMDKPEHDATYSTTLSGLEDYAILNLAKHTLYIGDSVYSRRKDKCNEVLHEQGLNRPGVAVDIGVNAALNTCDCSQLQNQVRRMLQAKSRAITQHNMKRGKLSGKDVYRVTMKDAKGFNERVFHNKRDALSLDVSVSLLCDFSGSMSGDRIANAIAATQLLANTLKSLQINHEIAGFTTLGTSITHILFKEFNLPARDLHKNMCNAFTLASANSDGDSILFAANRLHAQRSKRKVMLVLSDGSPASSKDGDDYQLLTSVLKSIESGSNIEVMGLGICTDYGKDYYKTWETLEHASDLQSGILNILRKQVFNV